MTASPTLDFHVWIPGDPVPKGRPRFARGHAYTPKRTRDYEKHVATLMIAARPEDWKLGVSYHLRMYVNTKRAMDIDNVLKTIMDAGQGVLWKNDRQVRRASIEIADPVMRAGVSLWIERTERGWGGRL